MDLARPTYVCVELSPKGTVCVEVCTGAYVCVDLGRKTSVCVDLTRAVYSYFVLCGVGVFFCMFVWS